MLSRTSILSGPPFLHSHHPHPSHYKSTPSRRGTNQADARTTEARETYTLCSLLQLNCLLILWSLTSSTWTWLDAPGNCIRTSWAPAEINNHTCANTPWKSQFNLGGLAGQALGHGRTDSAISLAISRSTFRDMICSILFWAFGPYTCHMFFQSTFEALHHLQLGEGGAAWYLTHCLACHYEEQCIGGKDRIYFGPFSGGSSYIRPFDSCAAPSATHQRPGWVNIVTACLWHSELSYLRKPSVLHRAFFQFLNASDKNELSDLVSRWSSPFKLWF